MCAGTCGAGGREYVGGNEGERGEAGVEKYLTRSLKLQSPGLSAGN